MVTVGPVLIFARYGLECSVCNEWISSLKWTLSVSFQQAVNFKLLSSENLRYPLKDFKTGHAFQDLVH
ncbi:hypothetical protein CDAR_37931 [Caerostris darwini]|uniref:Uncharacterized protein n=1 Tax=Caerostris darwini TaxID=1538125 RepID=A0AAV4T1Y8_9ARAC|nr:hypothetical protein CDAR_37931 [Caerostris darwini]